MVERREVTDTYTDREQTKAKHFILKRYLQALAFKVLRFADVAYVDGFSGPWRTQTENFADSSFMIAIDVLRDAQQKLLAQSAKRPKVCCFFSENDPDAFAKLAVAVAPFNKPEEDFVIKTYRGDFEGPSTLPFGFTRATALPPKIESVRPTRDRATSSLAWKQTCRRRRSMRSSKSKRHRPQRTCWLC